MYFQNWGNLAVTDAVFLCSLSLTILALFQEPADQSPGEWVGRSVFYNKQTLFSQSKRSE